MKNSSTLIAFVSAFALHLIIGGVLLMNIDFSLPKEKPKTPIINASVVSQKMFDDLAQRKHDKKLAEKRTQELRRQEQRRLKREKQRAEEKRKKIESERIWAEKEKVLRKKREVERIQAEKVLAAKQLKAKQEADKAKKLADAKAQKAAEKVKSEKIAQEKRKKIEAARIKKEKLAKEKALKEAKIVAEKEAKRKAAAVAERLRQNELDKQMAAEFEDSFSNAQSAKQLSEIARYTALIKNKISRNWQVEPDMKGKTCRLTIYLASDGFVRDVKQVRGDLKVCDSAKRAVLKAKTLPIPSDSETAFQFHEFDITLEPDF